MAALEDRVLTKILKSGSWREVIQRGLSEEHFLNPDSRMIFRFLRQHWYSPKTSGSLPTIDRVKQRWPSFTLTATSMDQEGALIALIDELKMKALESDVWAMSDYFRDLVAESPENAIAVLKKRLLEIEVKFNKGEETQGMGVQEILKMAQDHYKNAQTGAIYGVPWPWSSLTEDTLGKRGGDFVVFYGRMKSMKCICEGQRIMLPDGSLVPIEKVGEQAPPSTEVPSYTESTRKMRFAKAKKVVSGVKDCVEVETESGLRLRSSNEHLYMVPGGGYERICNLRPGDYVATARTTPMWKPNSTQISPEDAHFLGLLVGDGNYTRNEVQITTADEEVLAKVQKHADRFGAILHPSPNRPIEYRIVSKDERAGNPMHRNNVLNFLRELHIHGEGSNDKHIPEQLFSSTPQAIAAFLAGLLDTDGHVSSKFVSWSSTSRELLSGAQHLLMRFGVRGRIKEVTTNFGTMAYQLYVYSKEQAIILLEVLGPHLCLSRKRVALERLTKTIVRNKRNTDAIPYTKELKKLILAEKGSHCWPRTGASKYNQGKLFGNKGRISRQWLNQLADHFESEKLKQIANTDIIWEQIHSITDIGKVMCYDICIEDGQDPNFVVEGFVVHNTWILLYCAAVDYLVHNRRVLVWSKEMSPLKLGLRMATLLSKVDYQLFKKGLLPPRLEAHCFDVLKSLTTGNVKHDLRRGLPTAMRDLLLLAGRNAPSNLEGLKVKVDQFKPDVIYLDSFYHMDSRRSEAITVRWQRVATMAEDVKAYAEEVHLPIVAVHQANRYGEKTFGNTLADLADADVIAREADLIIRVLKTPGYIELHEEEYEEEFVRLLRDKKAAPAPVLVRRRPHIILDKNEKLIPREPVNIRLMERLLENNGIKRVGGELALVLGGNREGTLEAFTIKAIPSYNFNLITDKPDMKRIKEWMKIDEKEDGDKLTTKKDRAQPKTETSAADFSKALANSGMKV